MECLPLRAVREGHARGEEAKHIARTSQVHGRRPTNTPQRGEESAGGTARGASLGRGLRKAGALHLHLGIFQVVLEFGLAKVRVSLESMSSSRYGCELAIVGIPMSRIPWGRIRRGRDEHPRIHSRATPEFRSAGVGNTFTLQMHAGIGGSWKAPNPKTVAKRAFRYSLRRPLW